MDDGVSQGCQNVRRGSGSDPAGIFAHRHVPHVMESIFDVPVRADQFEEPCGIGLRAVEAGDEIRGFSCDRITDPPFAIDADDLGQFRPVPEVVVQSGRGGDGAAFAAAMRFVDGCRGLPVLMLPSLVIGGKNSPEFRRIRRPRRFSGVPDYP